MNFTKFPRSSLLSYTQLSVCDFLAPSFIQPSQASRNIRCLSTSPKAAAALSHNTQGSPSDQPSRKPKSGHEAASNPAPLNRPLTKAQRDFLSSAVCNMPSSQSHSNIYEVASKSCWRISSGSNLCCPNTSSRQFLSSSSSTYETHVRSRSRALQDVERPTRETSRPSYSYVSNLDSCSFCVGMGHRYYGTGGSNGMYGSCGDGDWRAL